VSHTFSQTKRILGILFFAWEQHDQNEIHSSSFETSQEEAGISSLFSFGLPPTDDNPIAFVVIKANFFQHTKVNISCSFGAITHDLPVIVVNRSFQIGVISFDIDLFKSASLLSIMPRRLSISLLSGISKP